MQTVILNVLGRDYPVKCSDDEHKQLMAVESRLDRQLSQYRLKYEQLDHQDCLSMALIEILMDRAGSTEGKLVEEHRDKLDQLASLLSAELV
ncbi:MAG: cell division protein ZapA [Bacteroidota bacterium]